MTTMVAVFEQEHYRIRSDETAANPGTPVWESDIDQATRTSIDADTLFRIRFVIANTGSANDTSTYSLYFSHEGGSYTAVAASGTAVITADAGTPSDADSLTTANFQLTAGTGSAIDGEYDENNSIASFSLDDGEYTEMEFCIQLNSAVVSPGDTIDLRVYQDGSSFGDANYDFTGLVVVSENVTITFTGDPPDGNGELTLTGKVPKKIVTESLDVPELELHLYSQVGLYLNGQAPTPIGGEALGDNHTRTWSTATELDLTGKEAALLSQKTPDREELALTGKVPVLAVGILVGKGTLTLVGKTPTLAITFIYSEAVESLEIIEKTPVLAYTIRGPPREELDLQGKAPIVGFSYIPARAQLALSGKTPTLDLTVSPARGELDLVGKQASVHWTVIPGRLELSLAGKQPAIPVTIPVGSLALTGKALTLNQTFSPGRYQLNLTGYAPLFGKIKVNEETLDLTGKAPSLNFSFLPGRDELDLVGKQATLHSQKTPARDELDLAGKTPTLDLALSSARDELDLAGKTPTLDLLLRPARDELDLTGKIPVLDLTLSPARYQLNLTGKAPLLPLFVGAGSLTLAGQDVSIDAIVPGKGSLALTGKAPTLDLTFVFTKGDLALTGKVPTLDSTLVSTEGDLTLAGKAPVLNLTVVSTEGDLTLTGKQASVHWSLTPTKGDLTLTGKQPAFNLAVTPSRLELSLTGYEPLFGAIKPDEGSLTLTGKIPTLEYSWTVTPAKGDLSLEGKEPFTVIPGEEGAILIPYGFLVLYSQRGLWLRGITPTVIVSQTAIDTGKGSIGLTGKAPTLTYSWTVYPTKGDLSLTGAVPNTQEFVRQPAEETLALTGKAPRVKIGPPIEITVPRRSLSLYGIVPTRSYGFLLVGHAPEIETPGVKEVPRVKLTLTGKVPDPDNTTPIPVEIPVPKSQDLELVSDLPALGIIDPTQGSTFILEGWEPLAEASSPFFFPDTGRLTFETHTMISDVEGLAPTAYLSLTGYQPNLASRTFIPGTGSLDLTGYGPPRPPTAEPSAAPLSLTGASVSLRLTLTPSKGTITVSSQEPPIVYEGTNWKPAPAAGSLTFSGEAPNRNVGKSPLVPVGDVVFTGQELILGATFSFEIDTAVLSFSGAVPTKDIDLPILLLRGSLVLDEKTFKLKLKRVRKTGARLKLVSLTTEYDIELLYR